MLVLDELQEVGVELVLKGDRKSMRRAGIDLQSGALDDLGRHHAGGPDRHDLIVVAVDDERRHVDFLQIFGEIDLRKFVDAIELPLEAAQHALKPKRVAYALRKLGARPVIAEEGDRQILVELAAIVASLLSEILEDFERQTARI